MTRRQLSIAPSQCPYLRCGLAGDPVARNVVDLLLADPVPQRLSVHCQPLGHRRDRRPLTRIVVSVLKHQTDGLRPRLRVVLARHEMHLPKKGGTHQPRDRSRTIGPGVGRIHPFIVVHRNIRGAGHGVPIRISPRVRLICFEPVDSTHPDTPGRPLSSFPGGSGCLLESQTSVYSKLNLMVHVRQRCGP